MACASVLLAGQLIEFTETQTSGGDAIQGYPYRRQDQQRSDGADHANDLLHIQAHDGDHDQGHRHAAEHGGNAELLFQQGAAAGQHDHGHRKHEEGDHQVDKGTQVASAQCIHYVLMGPCLQSATHARQCHPEKGEERGADHRPEQSPHAEVHEHHLQLPAGGESCTDNHTDKCTGYFQTFFHDDLPRIVFVMADGGPLFMALPGHRTGKQQGWISGRRPRPALRSPHRPPAPTGRRQRWSAPGNHSRSGACTPR
ncbi:hypothetical protein D3C71_819990 [compost metagenome]